MDTFLPLPPQLWRTPIYTDLDDVALDWTGGFRADMEPLLGRIIAPEPDSWCMRSWLGVEDAMEHVRRFNTSPAFGRLRAFACAQAVLRTAHRAGHPIIAITACADDAQTHHHRLENLARDFGPIFHQVHFVPLGGTKAPLLHAMAQHYGPGVWAEDNTTHALAGADAGHRVFVLRRGHNRAFEAANTDARLTFIDTYTPIAAHLGLRLAA